MGHVHETDHGSAFRIYNQSIFPHKNANSSNQTKPKAAHTQLYSDLTLLPPALPCPSRTHTQIEQNRGNKSPSWRQPRGRFRPSPHGFAGSPPRSRPFSPSSLEWPLLFSCALLFMITTIFSSPPRLFTPLESPSSFTNSWRRGPAQVWPV